MIDLCILQTTWAACLSQKSKSDEWIYVYV